MKNFGWQVYDDEQQQRAATSAVYEATNARPWIIRSTRTYLYVLGHFSG